MKKTLLILCALLLTAVGASAQTYKFVCSEWSSIDIGRVTDDNITYDTEANTITVVASGDQNIALSNGREAPFTTAAYTVSGWQNWFIVVGTNLSTTGADLWWMNGVNNGEWVPTLVLTLDDGQVLFAWDLSTMAAIDLNLHNEVNYLDGWTGFGLTSTTGTSVISDICFYTTEGAIEAYPSLDGQLKDAAAYEFLNTDWVELTDHPNSTATASENNTITITTTANSTTSIGLCNGNEAPYNTAGYNVGQDQSWFVIVGTNLSTAEGASILWWMNGYNQGMEIAPTETATLEDGQIILIWDLRESDAGTYLLGKKNTLNGFTCLGLTSTSTTSVISDICFYTTEGAIEAYPELSEELHDATPYEFKNSDWVALNDHTGTTATASTSGNTISVSYTDNEAGLGNMGTMATSGANTAGYYVTAEQHWFVIKGTGLSTTASDHLLWWMNGYNEGMTEAPTEVATLEDGSIVLAWDLSATQAGTNLKNDTNTLHGGTCFGLKSSTNSFTISYIGFYTDTQMDALVGIEWEMTEAEWGTLILPFDADVPTTTDEGETATLTLYAGSAIEVSGSTLTVGDAADAIAANTPYLVKGTAGTYTFSGTYEEATGALTSGMLTGTLVDMDYSDFTANGTEYVLQNHDGEGLAFYPITSDSEGVTLNAYHCYLTSSVTPTALHLPGMETGIVAVEGAEAEANGAIYDLSGRRVAKAVKGVYIQNGKKVLVK